MKNLMLLFVFLALAAIGHGQDEKFLFAIQFCEKPIANSANWQIEKNEIYQFVRFMGKGEYAQIVVKHNPYGDANSPNPTASASPAVAEMEWARRMAKITESANTDSREPNDRTFAVVKMGHVVIIAPVEFFSPVPAEKLQRAAAVYDRQIKELDDYENSVAEQRSRRQQQEQLDEIQGQLEQLRRQRQLDWINGSR